MKRAIWATALASGMLLAVANPAWADQGHLATPTDPYLGCPFGADVFGGVNFPNTEPEVWLAHNPAVPDNLIGATQQDRWSDGGGHGLVAPYSLDNGAKWTVTPLPFSKCAIPYYGAATLPYDRASDPWVDIGPDGTAYQISISFNANDNNNAVGATVSVDQGRTYIKTQPIITDLDVNPLQPFNDKESITADPNIAGTAYAVWDRLVLRSCGPAGRSHNTPRAEDRKWRGASQLSNPGAKSATGNALLCFEGPATFSKTVNGGTTWSTPVPIVSNAPDEQTIGNQIVVDRQTGRLYDFYLYFQSNGDAFIEDVFSDDGGATWSPRQTIDKLGAVGIHDEKTGQGYRTGDIIPEPAIDPNTGQLYVVWQDARFNTFDPSEDMVVISTSRPMTGTTGSWTPAVLVNEMKDHAAFTPAIKVNGLSQVAVDYYSFRQLSNGSKPGSTERYLRFTDGPIAIGADGTVSGTPFDSAATHVGGPFNMLAAAWAGGYFTGDYEGMAVDKDGKSVHDFFDQTNCLDFKCAATTHDAQFNPVDATNNPNPDDVFDDKFYRGS